MRAGPVIQPSRPISLSIFRYSMAAASGVFTCSSSVRSRGSSSGRCCSTMTTSCSCRRFHGCGRPPHDRIVGIAPDIVFEDVHGSVHDIGLFEVVVPEADQEAGAHAARMGKTDHVQHLGPDPVFCFQHVTAEGQMDVVSLAMRKGRDGRRDVLERADEGLCVPLQLHLGCDGMGAIPEDAFMDPGKMGLIQKIFHDACGTAFPAFPLHQEGLEGRIVKFGAFGDCCAGRPGQAHPNETEPFFHGIGGQAGLLGDRVFGRKGWNSDAFPVPPVRPSVVGAYDMFPFDPSEGDWGAAVYRGHGRPGPDP